MTNMQIIFAQEQELYKEGKIKGTGKILRFETDAGVVEFQETEPIHTFLTWKEKGYRVKKGEKAVARFSIWKYTNKKVKNEETGDEEQNGHLFLKEACFFSLSQVEKVA